MSTYFVRGKPFVSAKAVASHFGVSVVTVYAAANRGTLDRLGYGCGSRGATVILGLEFGTGKEAARALGMPLHYFKQGWKLTETVRRKAFLYHMKKEAERVPKMTPAERGNYEILVAAESLKKKLGFYE